jgi:predicted SnoaL-like aldol condensation-catalyzing enzyme
MSRKELAIQFLKMASQGEVRSAYDRFITPSFIHHNLYFKGDRDSLMAAMEEASRKSPNRSLDVKQCFEDGETVITHSLVTRMDPKAPGIAVVHIFRFEGDRVAELWDLGQPVPPDSPNENGPF